MIYQLIAKLQMLEPVGDELLEKEFLIKIIENLDLRIQQLEDKIESIELENQK